MNTPIVDFVKKYANSNSTRLHMPGHKGNTILGCEKYDITEIGGADVLYSADGIIAQSQKNASKLFGTEKTFYSTEGSSLCIRAMLYLAKCYALQNGKKPFIAAGRNAHKTFVTAAALLDIDVEWLMLKKTQSVISCDIDALFLENYLQSAKEKPIAVYVTSPDYLGNVVNIKALSEVCHKNGVLLLVDNAHGAYLKFLSEDRHPISLGADVCCDSAHKTLPVLTGGAYLHVAKGAPNFFALNASKALSLFASTSPSYLLLQSLDMANKYVCDGYGKKLSLFIDKVKLLKEELMLYGYTLCGNEPLKITLMTKPYGYTGYELSNILTDKNIVFMLTPHTKDKELEKLKIALCSINARVPIKDLPPVPTANKAKMSLASALYAKTEDVTVENCLGKVSASIDVSCPPAIPIVLPGEIIDEKAIECFKYYKIGQWSVIK